MIGVSLAMADKWILSFYAAGNAGAISLLTNAKSLFNAPLSVIGMAAGAASLPFFSSLFTQDRMYDFHWAVTRSVSRLIAAALLVTAWMVAVADPVVALLKGGSYTRVDAVLTARYFVLFALSLALWSAQGIYARAFYAARNTLTPAISGTLVTLCSIPVYALLYARMGVTGLAIASDIGIAAHTLALAVLLHRYRLVNLAGLEYAEFARAAAAAGVAYLAAYTLIRAMPHAAGHTGDALQIAAGTAAWAVVAVVMLVATRSSLLRQLRNRGA